MGDEARKIWERDCSLPSFRLCLTDWVGFLKLTTKTVFINTLIMGDNVAIRQKGGFTSTIPIRIL